MLHFNFDSFFLKIFSTWHPGSRAWLRLKQFFFSLAFFFFFVFLFIFLVCCLLHFTFVAFISRLYFPRAVVVRLGVWIVYWSFWFAIYLQRTCTCHYESQVWHWLAHGMDNHWTVWHAWGKNKICSTWDLCSPPFRMLWISIARNISFSFNFFSIFLVLLLSLLFLFLNMVMWCVHRLLYLFRHVMYCYVSLHLSLQCGGSIFCL